MIKANGAAKAVKVMDAKAVDNHACYKKSSTEKGNSRDFGSRFWRNFIFAKPKAL
jgi:hypothetical protein